MTFQWELAKKQIRVEGTVKKLTRDSTIRLFNRCSKSEKLYFYSMARSQDDEHYQSSIIESYEYRLKAMENYYLDYMYEEMKEVPFPEDWSGFIIIPHYFEFLDIDIPYVLRYNWTKTEEGWVKQIMSP